MGDCKEFVRRRGIRLRRIVRNLLEVFRGIRLSWEEGDFRRNARYLFELGVVRRMLGEM